MSATMSSVDFSTTEDDTKGRQRRSSRPFIGSIVCVSFFAAALLNNNLRTFVTPRGHFRIAIWIVRFSLIIAIDSRSNKNTLTTCHQTKNILIRPAIKPSSEWI